MSRHAPLEERFSNNVMPEPNSGCWLWTGYLKPNGYAAIYADGEKRYAHRISYEMHIGPIPEGLVIDHKCRVRSCVNPDHLEPVTVQENIKRGDMPGILRARFAAITHCPKGHPYAGDNLSIRPSGARVCKACSRAATMAWWRKNRPEPSEHVKEYRRQYMRKKRAAKAAARAAEA